MLIVKVSDCIRKPGIDDRMVSESEMQRVVDQFPDVIDFDGVDQMTWLAVPVLRNYMLKVSFEHVQLVNMSQKFISELIFDYGMMVEENHG